MQTILINSEPHVGFNLRLSIDDEHHLVAPLGDKVLETQVPHGYDIGDRVFTQSHTIVVLIHCCLMGHCYCAAIALHSNFRF